MKPIIYSTVPEGRRQCYKYMINLIIFYPRFIKGYMARGEAKTTDNSEYLAFVRQNYLNRLKDNLPKMVLDKTSWLTPPPVLTEVCIDIGIKLH